MSPKKKAAAVSKPSTPASEPTPSPSSNADINASNTSIDNANNNDEDVPQEELQGTAGQANKEMRDVGAALEQAAASVSDTAVGKVSKGGDNRERETV
jgi:hypothetical protein